MEMKSVDWQNHRKTSGANVFVCFRIVWKEEEGKNDEFHLTWLIVEHFIVQFVPWQTFEIFQVSISPKGWIFECVYIYIMSSANVRKATNIIFGYLIFIKLHSFTFTCTLYIERGVPRGKRLELSQNTESTNWNCYMKKGKFNAIFPGKIVNQPDFRSTIK